MKTTFVMAPSWQEIYSIYCFSTLIMGNQSNWNSLGLVAILMQMLFSWFFFFAKYKTYEFRAYYVTIVCQFNILFYAYYINDVFEILSTFSALVILLSLYELPRIVGIPNKAGNKKMGSRNCQCN